MKISVSFLSDKYNASILLDKINKTEADYIHVDVMDGIFVNNKNMLYEDALKIKNYFKKNLDVHLMVYDIEKYINEFKNLKPKYITFHVEATNNIMKYINLVKENNIKSGLSINPDTDVSKIEKYLPYIDLVLVMSVVPGKGGQVFEEKVINKIKYIRKIIDDNHYKCLISVDGGINEKTALLVKEAGVNIIVSGSYLHDNNINEKINYLKNI